MQKSKVDVYTALLGLSLLAIIVAIIFMLMEMSAYKWDYKAQGARGIGALDRPAIQRFDQGLRPVGFASIEAASLGTMT